ncbi:uncharacterized protein LOC112523204 [Cynara cardunculus var. scolymus]|uniref:uncharacterized protein LOC112523204 n=1 Tax=Cynara cardunculus var. scolymus TaxID=59895 RepID=UPI000D630E51|nr:uncharacterized protein LOC112523204 [Cynara cardunculus var. scolymus]
MELAEINLIGDFEAGMKCLQNPSLLSKLSLIDKIPQLCSFWTWGALILAVFATFTSVFNRIKLCLYQIRLKLLTSCQKSCPQQIFGDDDFDFSDDDADDDTPSSVAESDDDQDLDSEDDRVDEVFRAEGSSYWGNNRGSDGNFTLRRRNGFSWSDFSAGKSVVQLWDSFGLGLDFEDDESEYGSEIAIWDLDRDVKISSGRRCQVAAAAENVVLTAEMNDSNGGVGFGTYDSRVDGKSPAIYAAWRPRQRKI